MTSHSTRFNAPGVTMTRHTCTECKGPCPGEHVLTCSAKCRKQRERRQKRQHAAWVGAMNELQDIRDALKRGEDVKHHRECLIRLKDEINDLLLLANDEDARARREMLEARARRVW